MEDQDLRSLSDPRFNFPGSEGFFDCAAIGLESKEARDVAKIPGAVADWETAVDQVKTEFALFLGCMESHVAVFYNTTAAAQRILLCLKRAMGSYQGTLLLTDAEYPGIIAAAHEYWDGGIAIARISRLLWRGRTAEAEDVLARTFLASRPCVVYVSHVSRAVGYTLPLQLLTFMKSVLPRLVIVIDGAQAIGNVAVTKDVLEIADFYLSSGHKWLCGKPALGLVHSRDVWSLSDQAQGYSSRSGSAGTGSLEVLRSTARALRDFNGSATSASSGEERGRRIRSIAQWNATLAREFAGAASRLGNGIRVVGDSSWDRNGIVTLRDPGGRITGDALSRFGIQATHLRAEPYFTAGTIEPAGRRFTLGLVGEGNDVRAQVTPISLDQASTDDPAGGGWRFSFHYYHEEDDVKSLVRALEKIVTEADHAEGTHENASAPEGDGKMPRTAAELPRRESVDPPPEKIPAPGL